MTRLRKIAKKRRTPVEANSKRRSALSVSFIATLLGIGVFEKGAYFKKNVMPQMKEFSRMVSSSSSTSGISNDYFAPPSADFEFCDANNFIPERAEYPKLERNVNNSRPWFSLRRQDFEPQHANKCQTAQEITDAIRYGTRRFDDPALVTALQKRTIAATNFTRSTFVTHQCDLNIMPPHELCSSVNRFSKIVYQGDSLSRHAHYGLQIALSNNLVRGSAMNACQCDAQFSNHDGCHAELHFTANAPPYQRRMCPHLPIKNQVEIAFTINRLHKGVYQLNKEDSEATIDCANPEQKEVLLVVQGGVHLGYNAASTFLKLVLPFFRDPVVQECIRHQKLYLIFCLTSGQSPEYDKKYEIQSLNQTMIFDIDMLKKFETAGIRNVGFLHWANFTEGALHTDGFHLTTQTNYFKAQQTVNLANAMLDEGLALQHPDYPSSLQ